MLKALIINLLMLMHPVHVTLTTVNQAQGSDTMNVFFRMYYDDFLRDYKLYYPDLAAGEKSDTTGISREMFLRYFNDRVSIYVNGKQLQGKITDFTTDSYEIRINLAYRSFANPAKFRIRNKILTTVYTDQANMVYINIGKYQNAVNLTVADIDATVSLK
jgi:hypothetical protein